MSLTDDWKDGAIHQGTWCWVQVGDEQPEPMVVDCNGWLVSLDNDYNPNNDFFDLKVLAICDYEEFQSLRNENANYQAVNDKLFACNKSLRALLKECKPALSHLGKWNTQRQYLLTKINKALK